MDLTPQQSQRLLRALRAAGTKTDGLRAVNPYSLEGNRARDVQMALEAADPVLAAELSAPFRVTSLELAAAMADPDFNPTALSGSAAQEWAEANPTEAQQLQQQREAEILASWDQQAREMAIAGGRDPDAVRQPQNWRERFAAEQAALDAAGLGR